LATQSVDKIQGLDRQTLLGIYRTMYLSRRIDDKESSSSGRTALLPDQRRGPRGDPGRGGPDAEAHHDWFTRTTAPCAHAVLGMTPLGMLIAATGAKDDPNSAVGCRPTGGIGT
jgi:2-oxoisovalerate dehydrogenase E1 component